MKTITIDKPDKTLRGTIQLPFSKSLSNRLLMLRALADKDFTIVNSSVSGDTLLLAKLLNECLEKKGSRQVVELDTKNAGTAMRFLTAYLAGFPGKWILTGSDRMKERPIGPLVDALLALGADIQYLSKLDYPPLLITGRQLHGCEISLNAGISSQFGSALMLVAPSIEGGLVINLKGQAVSRPYLDMSLRLLNHFGVKARKEGPQIQIPQSKIQAGGYHVEADWSSAAFWYECSAFADEVDLFLPGLEADSLQGDSVLPGIYQNFGIVTEFTKEGVHLSKKKQKIDGFYFHFIDYPDIAPPVIVSCAAAGIRGRFEGLKSLRIKESDRLSALQAELIKVGIGSDISIEDDQDLTLEFPPSRIKPVPDILFESYQDHRIAMAFAPLALKIGKLRIENPDVVKKSYPGFWEDMVSVGFRVE